MIKLPEGKEIKFVYHGGNGAFDCGYESGWNAAITEVQRLNATAQPVSDGWVKCSESMPEEMSDVLVTDGKDVKDMWWNGKKWDSWADRYSLDSDSITHWMPKPSAPGGQDD